VTSIDEAAIIPFRVDGDAWSLEQRAYTDEQRYAAELDAIWRAGWIFAGHRAEVSDPGDVLTLEIGSDPLLVVRQRDGSLRAFHNVCRHRGSLIVERGRDHLERIVCPYHRWSYDLDGGLRASPGFSFDDATAYALREISVAEAAGLVFVSIDDHAPDFAPFAEVLLAQREAAGLRTATVAARRTYEIAANWKLVLENNRECLHCAANHREYVRANYDVHRAGDPGSGGLAEFPDPEGTSWWSVTRSPMRPPFVTESLDGALVSRPFPGIELDDPETLRLRMLPNFWAHVSVDHAVSTRLSPAGPGVTRAVVTWLVAEGSEEGTDYALAALLPFWQLTSEQDWAICERQQRGVCSSGYAPGPLSKELEYNVVNLHVWLRRRLATGGEGNR
jgi:glycine betaine catabolism A